MTGNHKKQLLCLINEATFAMQDVALFLDTHPCNEEALEYYEEYRKIREDAVREYDRQFGPLLIDGEQKTDVWLWALQPWPWKGECE